MPPMTQFEDFKWVTCNAGDQSSRGEEVNGTDNKSCYLVRIPYATDPLPDG